jgi:hypothetical protein
MNTVIPCFGLNVSFKNHVLETELPVLGPGKGRLGYEECTNSTVMREAFYKKSRFLIKR